MEGSGLLKFKEVAILNPYNLKDNKGYHQTIVDVKASTHSDKVVIIEIHVDINKG